MTTYSCYPPRRHHATHRLLPSEALSFLSEYLGAAGTDAFLHPNALLTEAGPITPSSGTHQMGLVLHNLKRVEAGLRGEQLSTDSILDKNDEGELQATELALQDLRQGDSEGKAANADGWQDKAEFEREQGTEQGDIGDRNNAANHGSAGVSVPKVDIEGTKSAVDKEARKRMKKLRRLQDRRRIQVRDQMESPSEE